MPPTEDDRFEVTLLDVFERTLAEGDPQGILDLVTITKARRLNTTWKKNLTPWWEPTTWITYDIVPRTARDLNRIGTCWIGHYKKLNTIYVCMRPVSRQRTSTLIHLRDDLTLITQMNWDATKVYKPETTRCPPATTRDITRPKKPYHGEGHHGDYHSRPHAKARYGEIEFPTPKRIPSGRWSLLGEHATDVKRFAGLSQNVLEFWGTPECIHIEFKLLNNDPHNAIKAAFKARPAPGRDSWHLTHGPPE